VCTSTVYIEKQDYQTRASFLFVIIGIKFSEKTLHCQNSAEPKVKVSIPAYDESSCAHILLQYTAGRCERQRAILH